MLVFAVGIVKVEDYTEWLCECLYTYREEIDLKGFQMLRMFDPEWNKEQIRNIIKQGTDRAWNEATPEERLQATEIADRVITAILGYSAPISAEDMSSDMLAAREKVIKETAYWIKTNISMKLDYSISEIEEKIYNRFSLPRT